MKTLFSTEIVFETGRIPNETSLSVIVSSTNKGIKITEDCIKKIILDNPDISVVTFIGGDHQPEIIFNLGKIIRRDYPRLKVAWFSDLDFIPDEKKAFQIFHYVKYNSCKSDRSSSISNYSNKPNRTIDKVVTSTNLNR